ncbi:MAG: IS3 family transposase, partial [Clostridiales Family XIII bacterium]|nr:IS3 family transposase [Clostridiales Family XIII bacterium]
QESFYGHIKDEMDISQYTTFDGIHQVVSDWTDYYNFVKNRFFVIKSQSWVWIFLSPVAHKTLERYAVVEVRLHKNSYQVISNLS